MYACLYILEIWNVKLYDYPELILIFYRLVTFKNLLNTFHHKTTCMCTSNQTYLCTNRRGRHAQLHVVNM